MNKNSWKLNCWINNKALNSRTKRKRWWLLDSLQVGRSKCLFFFVSLCLKTVSRQRPCKELQCGFKSSRCEAPAVQAGSHSGSLSCLPASPRWPDEHTWPLSERSYRNKPVLLWPCCSPAVWHSQVPSQPGWSATVCSCQQHINICLTEGQHLRN